MASSPTTEAPSYGHKKRPIEKKLKILNLEEKFRVIKMVCEEKKSIREVTAHFKCGKTQIYNIIKEKDKIIEKYLTSNKTDLVKRKEKGTKYHELNRIMFEWFSAARAKNFPISGPILQGKAKETAEILHLNGFSASNGWLESFRRRHGITFNASYGGVNNADKNAVENWHEKLKEIIRHYNPKDIANADETALFFRALPNKTLQIKGEKCSGGRYSKERLTVLLIAFGDGKLEKPWVIGTSENPCCFKNLRKNQLPVEWKANKNAWMTSAIFEDFLKKLNKRMEQENRNILLFLDGAACHPKIQLSNVRLVFLPPCTTSVLQPLDNGIIQCVKLEYRKLMLQHIIANMNDCKRASETAIKIDVLDAIGFLSHSIKCVRNEFVIKCFRNCGFNLENGGECGEIVCFDDSSEIQTLIDKIDADNSMNAESFVNIDKNVLTETDEIDLKYIIESKDGNSEKDIEDEQNGKDSEETEIPTSSQVLNYINAIKLYAKMKGENELHEKAVELAFSFNRIRKPIEKTKQLKLDTFFK